MIHPCSISMIGKQRNGSPRLWCVVHRAQARMLDRCGNAGEPTTAPTKVKIEIAKYPGGVALWGALAPVINTGMYDGGFQVWGTHPAILWTAPVTEESGIHVHGFKAGDEMPTVDETYDEVEIEGVRLEPEQIRILMAQMAIPGVAERLTTARCPRCDTAQFDIGMDAITARRERKCTGCGRAFEATGRRKVVISNPMVAAAMSINANRITNRRSRSKSQGESHPRRASAGRRRTRRTV